MTTKVSAPSPEEWKRYEKSLRERKKFIESYRAEIEMKPIKTENSLQAGDHLVREGNCSGPSTYYHHMLCTSVDNNKITVIHYTGPWSPGTSDLLSCIFCKDSGFFGKVCEEDITFLKLMKDKVRNVSDVGFEIHVCALLTGSRGDVFVVRVSKSVENL